MGGWFSRSEPYDKYKQNVPSSFYQNEDGQCLAYFLTDDQRVATRNSYHKEESLEYYFCERMFSAKAIDFFEDPNKSSPAKYNNFEEVEILSVDDIDSIKYRIGAKTYQTIVSDKRGNRSDLNSLEDLKSRWGATYRNSTIKHRDYYRTLTPEHSDFYEGSYKFHITRDFLSASNDWEELVYFNIWAKELWDELVDNLGATQARIFYKTLRNDNLSNEQEINLKDKIKIYHMALKSFLETSRSYDTGGLSLVKNFHPLFVQVLLESLSDFNNFYANTMSNHNDKSYMLEMMKYLTILSESEVATDYHRLASLSEIKKNKGKLRRYINTVILLGMMGDNCHTYGLWPGASRWLLDFINSYDNSLIYANSPTMHLLARIKTNILSACGDFSPYFQFNAWGGTPMQKWKEGIEIKRKDFIKIYSNLFNKFYK